MFNVDQSADYLGGYMGNPLDQKEPKKQTVAPSSSSIPYKSEAQGQKDLILKHQQFLLENIRNAKVNKEIADVYKNFLVSRLKIVFLVEDKEGFLQNGKTQENSRILKQIDSEITNQQKISESLKQKFDSLFRPQQVMVKNDHMKVGEMMFMVDQPVDHNKIEGFIRLIPSLNKFHTSGQQINDLDKIALNQINESRSTHLPPEAKNDLQSEMRQTQERQYVRQHMQMQPPVRQSHQQPNSRVPQRQRVPQVAQAPMMEQDAVELFNREIQDVPLTTKDPKKIVLGTVLVAGVGWGLYNYFIKSEGEL